MVDQFLRKFAGVYRAERRMQKREAEIKAREAARELARQVCGDDVHFCHAHYLHQLLHFFVWV